MVKATMGMVGGRQWLWSILGCISHLVAKWLSMRLLILQSVFSAGGVCPNFCPTTVPLRCGLCTNIHAI